MDQYFAASVSTLLFDTPPADELVLRLLCNLVHSHALVRTHGVSDIYFEGISQSFEDRPPDIITYDRASRLTYQDDMRDFGEMLADYKKAPSEQRKEAIPKAEARLDLVEAYSSGLMASCDDLYKSGYLKKLRGLEDRDAWNKAHPDQQITLTVITPKAIARNDPGYVPRDPKNR